MEIEKHELVRTLVETAVAHVIRSPEIVTGEEAFAAIRDRLIAQEAIEEFDRFRDNYLYDGWFQWIHGEPCLLIDLNWKDIGSAVYQLKSLGWTDLEAFRVARRGPLVASEMSISDKEAIISLISTEKKKEAAAEPRTRKRPGTDLSVSQVAALLQVSRTTVIGLISTGKLKAFSAALPGAKRKSWRICPTALDEFRSETAGAKPIEIKEPAKRRRRLPQVKKYV